MKKCDLYWMGLDSQINYLSRPMSKREQYGTQLQLDRLVKRRKQYSSNRYWSESAVRWLEKGVQGDGL